MREPDLYVVHYYWTDPSTGGCVSLKREEWAFSAADAKLQLELLLSVHGDRYFKVTEIEPLRDSKEPGATK